MQPALHTSTPSGVPAPIGPYSHIARAGPLIWIAGTAGVNPATGELAGPDVYSQTCQIIDLFRTMLRSVGSDLDHIAHVTAFLKHMHDFDAMNRAYALKLSNHRPARTVVAVSELARPGALIVMNATAVAAS